MVNGNEKIPSISVKINRFVTFTPIVFSKKRYADSSVKKCSCKDQVFKKTLRGFLVNHSIGAGFLLINKPVGLTSFACVHHIRRIIRKKIKVGHSGTLDDFASGLLIICIGRQATRYVPELMGLSKEYIVKAKLGELTDSLDVTGTILETKPVGNITQADLEHAMQTLMPSYMQIPPIYSALKHQGKPLYELARKGKISKEELESIVGKKMRTVNLYDMEILDFDAQFFTIRALVSKGTYIRSLANDVAVRCGLPATTYELTRTKIGKVSLEQAKDLSAFKTIDDIHNYLIPLSLASSVLVDSE